MSPMTKTSQQPKPDGLEQKFKLLALLPYDERAKRKHSLVFGFVLDWYHSKYGDALASVRHVVETIRERDPAGKGLGQASVHSALTDLTAWGYLQQNVGSGKRASRYIPNWSKLSSSVHPVENTTSVHPALNDDVHPALNANLDSVHHVLNEDPSTGPGDKTRGHVVGNEFEAAPVAPLADGLVAAAACPASGGFEEFWSIWPRKHGKAAARTAFGKVDAGLHDSILVAASAWAEHYAKHGVDRKWIPEPANWLAKERWDEDLPIIHDDAKGAAIAKAKANAPAEKASVSSEKAPRPNKADAAMVGEINPFSSYGTFRAEIYEASVTDRDAHTKRLTLRINLGDGSETFHKFDIHAPDLKDQERGLAMLRSITDALEIDGDISDTDDLLFRPFVCTIGEGTAQLFITYAPPSANDNEPIRTAA